MGLITQTNAQYYTGSETSTHTSAVYNLFSTLGVDLYDSITNTTNFKIFVDPTGSGSLNNFIEYPSSIENGLSNGVGNLSWIPTGTIGTPGGYVVEPTSTNGFGGLLLVNLDQSGELLSVSVLNAGSDYTIGTVLTIPPNVLGAGSLSISTTLNALSLYTGPSWTTTTDGSNEIIFYNTGVPGPVAPYTQVVVKIQLIQDAIWEQYGDYEYISINDVVDNFVVGYTGEGKLLETIKRSDIVFHAKRGLQEFSYDTLRSIKSQELTLSPTATAVIPQDYVNYVQMSWVDGVGIKHPIYPTQLTSSPTQPLVQGSNGLPSQDNFGENLEAGRSNTNINWEKVNTNNIDGLITTQDLNANIYNWTWWDMVWGQRYGLNPVDSNMNGWFIIDKRRNVFSFSSNLNDKTIILEYLSDGLGYDEDTKIPKMAEQAMYMHIAWSILTTKPNIPEYIVRRYKLDRRAALRNAKIRLSNIKLSEFIQTMRGKSKWIKH